MTSLTGMAGLALPAVGTLAVEVVDQVDAAAPVLTRVVFALVDVWRERVHRQREHGGGATGRRR